MKIIDSHVHICNIIAGYCRRGELRAIGSGKAAWANGDVVELFPKGYGDTNFTAETAIKMMDENGVEAGVILQGSMYGFQNIYIEETLKKYPTRFRGACTVDPFAKNALETLEYLLKWTNIVKFEVSSGGGLMGVHDDFDLDGPKMMPIYEIINSKNGTVVIDMGDFEMASYQPNAILNVAKTFPKMQIVMCHLLAPKQGKTEITKRDLALLNLENIVFDIAALPKISGEKYPYPFCFEALSIAKNILGSEKILFGTDMPFAAAKDSYKNLTNYIVESNVFSASELENIFYSNSRRIYFK